MPEVADLSLKREFPNIALGIDVRAGQILLSFESVIECLKKKRIKYKIIYFDANDSTLLHRFFETRRRHP